MIEENEFTEGDFAGMRPHAVEKLQNARTKLLPGQIEMIEILLAGADTLHREGQSMAGTFILMYCCDLADGYHMVPPEA